MNNLVPPTIQDPLEYIRARLEERPLDMGSRPPTLKYNAPGCYICWKCLGIRANNTFRNDHHHHVSCGGKEAWICRVCLENGIYFQCVPTGRAEHIKKTHPEF